MKLLILLMLFGSVLFSQKKLTVQTSGLKNITLQQLIDSIKSSRLENITKYKQQLINIDIDNYTKAGGFMEIGLFFYKEKNNQKSIEFFDDAIKFLKIPEHNKDLYSLYFLKGSAYLNMWKNQEALDAYQNALDANDNSDVSANKYGINKVLTNSNIAIIRRRMNQLEEAKKINLNTLNFINKNEIKNGVSRINHVNILEHVSQVYLDLEKYDSAMYYSDKGILLSESNNYRVGLASLKTIQGTVFYHKKQYEKSLSLLRSSEEILLKNKTIDKVHLLNSIYYQAKCFYDQDEFDQAIAKLLEATHFIEQDEVTRRIIDVYHLLAACNVKVGNTNEAIKWYDKHIRLKDIFLSEKDSIVNRINENDKKTLDTQIQTLIKNKKTRSNYISFSIIILVVGIATLITFLIRNLRKQKKNQILFDDLIQKMNYLESKEKEKKSTKEIELGDEKINKIVNRLDKLEEQEYYLNLDCNLRSMAKKLKTNATYLTKTINVSKQKNFNDYINDLRIDYVLKRLKNDKTFRLFSVKSIAREIGYKSDYSFVKHFKAKTGLNPSYYIKNINKENT